MVGVLEAVGEMDGVAPSDREGEAVEVTEGVGVPDDEGVIKAEQKRLTEPGGPLLESNP